MYCVEKLWSLNYTCMAVYDNHSIYTSSEVTVIPTHKQDPFLPKYGVTKGPQANFGKVLKHYKLCLTSLLCF